MEQYPKIKLEAYKSRYSTLKKGVFVLGLFTAMGLDHAFYANLPQEGIVYEKKHVPSAPVIGPIKTPDLWELSIAQCPTGSRLPSRMGETQNTCKTNRVYVSEEVFRNMEIGQSFKKVDSLER